MMAFSFFMADLSLGCFEWERASLTACRGRCIASSACQLMFVWIMRYDGGRRNFKVLLRLQKDETFVYYVFLSNHCFSIFSFQGFISF